MNVELRNCPNCNTSGVIPMEGNRCPNCKQDLGEARTQNRQHNQVTGLHKDAVAALQDFINRLQNATLDSNPFSNPRYKISINVDSVQEGSAFLRYMFLSIFGRPTVVVSFSLSQDGKTIVRETFKSSVFFQDSRDVGFRGGALGGRRKSTRLNSSHR